VIRIIESPVWSDARRQLRRLDLEHRFDNNDWFLRRRIRYRAVDECGSDTLST